MSNNAVARMRRMSGALGPRHADGVLPEPQTSNDSLTAVQDKAIIEYVERWKDHGFQLRKQSMVSEIASAYLKHHGSSDNGTSRHSGIFARNEAFHKRFKRYRAAEMGEPSNKDPAMEDSKLCEFIDQFAAIRSDHRLNNEHIYVLSDTGYATTIQKDRQPLNVSRRRSSENRGFASVIYCYPARGKPLSPYVIFKSSKVQGPRSHEDRITISFNGSGWAETTHALDWLQSVFEKETSPFGRRERQRGRGQRRLLLVDSLFPVTPEFFVTCWERNVICLCLPKKGSEYLNPFDNGIFSALDKLYAEHMKKQLRVNCPYTISPSRFATFIDRELGFPDRDTESMEAWFNSCLLPPSRTRLLSRRTGDRIRSQTVEPNTPTRARRRHVSPDENNVEEDDDLAVIVRGEEVSSRQSLRGPRHRETPTQEVPEEPEASENSSDNDHVSERNESEQSSSEEESSNIQVPITPCRTPKQPKTPKSSRKLEALSDPVMSLEDFRECLDRYEEASTPDRKRHREEMALTYAKCVWTLEQSIQSSPLSSSKRSRTR